MSTTETPRTRHTGRTVVLIVAGVVVASMIVWLAVGAVRTLTRPDASGTFEIEDRFDSVVLDSDLADVRIAYGDVDRGELTFRQGDSRERLELDHEVRGETLHVSLRQVREFWMPRLPWFGDVDPQLQLVLPASLERESVTLDVSTDMGDVDASGAFATVVARSDVGDIELRGSAESLDVHTDVGEIDLAGFSTDGELAANSGVGDVTLELEALPSGIAVETDTGEVHVNLPEGRYAVSTNTSVGDVEVEVRNDPSATRRYEFITSIGDISITS